MHAIVSFLIFETSTVFLSTRHFCYSVSARPGAAFVPILGPLSVHQLGSKGTWISQLNDLLFCLTFVAVRIVLGSTLLFDFARRTRLAARVCARPADARGA